MIKHILFFILLFVCLISTNAFSITYSFIDNANTFPNWTNNTDQDNEDVIWNPNILNGTYTINNGILNEITVTFENWEWNPQQGLWRFLSPGDLFIDIGADNHWNYVFNFWDNSAPIAGVGPVTHNPLPATLYYFENNLFPISSDSYYMSNWTNGRLNHPISYNLNNLSYTSILPTFASLLDWGYTTIIFSELNIPLNNKSLAFGWTVNCGNDVIHQVVPEQSTIILLLLGLSFLILFKKIKYYERK